MAQADVPNAGDLTDVQAHALLDILSHYYTCAEIEKFKHDGAIHGYGPPFTSADTPSTSPILQTLLTRFITTAPGIRDVNGEFWKQRAWRLVEKFGEADLSDSYDKGAIGARRTLGTAYATLFEYPARGVLAGHAPIRAHAEKPQEYDKAKVEDIVRAWDDFRDGLVHENLIDELFDKATETANIEDHTPMIQAAHEYLILNIAATMHYLMVLSPDGQYLTRIIANVHTLVPYGIVRQTLKVGNAATMINGMVRLVLAKMSITGVTNWLGLTKSDNDGMNLLQQIMSTAIGWDITELEKQAAAVKKSKDAPSKEHFHAIKEHISGLDRSKQELVRETSKIESKSIVNTILTTTAPNLPKLSENEHAVALEYLSVQLSIHDRQQIDHILCKHQPDIVTQAVKDVVAAYDPIIRGVHNAVDLSVTLWDFQNFMDDFVKLAKKPYLGKRSIRNPAGVHVHAGTDSDTEGPSSPKPEKAEIPTVEDYVKLIRKHIPNSHKFLHEIAKNGKQVTKLYRDWLKSIILNFRPTVNGSEVSNPGGAGTLTPALNDLYKSLPTEHKDRVQSTLDAHAAYLSALHTASRKRLASILAAKSHSHIGPGMYLSRWQDYLDSTLITPLTPEGPVRTGREMRAAHHAHDANEGKLRGKGAKEGLEEEKQDPPDVTVVIDTMGKGFVEVVGSLGMIHNKGLEDVD